MERFNIKYIVGIDEVGRGPLAGPFTVGAVIVPYGAKIFLKGVKDSKQLSHEERIVLLGKMNELRDKFKMNYSVTHVRPHVLDRLGLTKATERAVKRCLEKIGALPHECRVLLDGGLRAPAEYVCQKTIVKGDEKRQIIALASIAAKVTRDRILIRAAKRYPEYDFHLHKGYGTRHHSKMIEIYGPCAIHRKTFLSNILNKNREHTSSRCVPLNKT